MSSTQPKFTAGRDSGLEAERSHSFISRTYLFVPGDRPERFPKALASGADVVIVDLEDAVPEERKGIAREQVAAWLTPTQPVYLRVNAPETEWFHADLELCRKPGVAGILLPKAQHLEEIVWVVESAASQPILPMIETALGFANAQMLAGHPAVRRLVFGSFDFQVDLGIEGDGEELLYFRSQLVLVSRLAGLDPPVDGVTTQINEPTVLRADAAASRRRGFGGKLCIHPNQIAVVNECFSPSAEEVAWAQRVIDAAHSAAGGAIALDGKMVDRPIIIQADKILRACRGAQL